MIYWFVVFQICVCSVMTVVFPGVWKLLSRLLAIIATEDTFLSSILISDHLIEPQVLQEPLGGQFISWSAAFNWGYRGRFGSCTRQHPWKKLHQIWIHLQGNMILYCVCTDICARKKDIKTFSAFKKNLFIPKSLILLTIWLCTYTTIAILCGNPLTQTFGHIIRMQVMIK